MAVLVTQVLHVYITGSVSDHEDQPPVWVLESSQVNPMTSKIPVVERTRQTMYRVIDPQERYGRLVC